MPAEGSDPLRWVALSFPRPQPWEELPVVHGLRGLGARSVEEDRGRLVVYLPTAGDPSGLIRAAEGVLRSAAPASDPALRWRILDPGERVGPPRALPSKRRINQRIVLAAPESGPLGDRGEIRIRIDAGTAFGGGEHATTRGCLRLMDGRFTEETRRTLDLGTGTGVLAIAATLMGAREVWALEGDALACDVARRNVVLNGVGDRVHVKRLLAGVADLRALPLMSAIVANVEPGALLPLLPALLERLGPGGVLVTSGASRGERPGFIRRVAAGGLHLEEEDEEEGWWSGAFRRP